MLVHSRKSAGSPLELTFDMLHIKITRIFLLVLFPRAMTHKGHIYLFDLGINGNIPEPLICVPNLWRRQVMCKQVSKRHNHFEPDTLNSRFAPKYTMVYRWPYHVYVYAYAYAHAYAYAYVYACHIKNHHEHHFDLFARSQKTLNFFHIVSWMGVNL